MRIFGSVVRGDADGRSDVDFLVDMDSGRSLFDLGALLMDLQDMRGSALRSAVSVSRTSSNGAAS